MRKALVSIYVSTYNHRDYIAECLEGIVMQQTDFPFEAIVIDDCSTDDTPEIIARYAERYPDIIKPVYNSENWFSRRKSKIYPIFVAKAQGEFFAVCDGDDYWTDPHKLQVQIDFLRSHPDYSACGHHNLRIPDNIDTSYLRKDVDMDIMDMVQIYHIQSSTVVARFDILRNDKELYRIVEIEQCPFSDFIVFTALLNAGKIRFLHMTSSVYRKHDGNLTRIVSKSQQRKIHDLKIRYVTEIYGGKFADLTKRMLSEKLLRLSSRHSSEGRYMLALRYKIRAFLNFPAYVLKLYKQRYM